MVIFSLFLLNPVSPTDPDVKSAENEPETVTAGHPRFLFVSGINTAPCDVRPILSPLKDNGESDIGQPSDFTYLKYRSI